MIIDISLEDLRHSFLAVLAYVWIATAVRSMMSQYFDERYRNTAIFSVFCMTLLCICTFSYGVGLSKVPTIYFDTRSLRRDDALFYIIAFVLAMRPIFNYVFSPLYRAILETDKAKDKRFGVVHIQHQ